MIPAPQFPPGPWYCEDRPVSSPWTDEFRIFLAPAALLCAQLLVSTGRWSLPARLCAIAAVWALPAFSWPLALQRAACASLAFILVPAVILLPHSSRRISTAHAVHDFALLAAAHFILPVSMPVALLHALAAISTIRCHVPQKTYRYCVIAIYSLMPPPYGPATLLLFYLPLL